MPLLYSRHRLDLARADALLGQVGLMERVHHKPNELSGGQQQRVAIARALVNEPRIILADEPTGNLDTASQQEILAVLRALNRRGITIVMVTHEEEVAREARRRIRIRDGIVQSDERTGAEPSAMPAMALPPSAEERWHLREIGEHLHQGLRALATNKVRTALSMLGILIGVAAVVAMLALLTQVPEPVVEESTFTLVEAPYQPALVDVGRFEVTSDLEDHIALLDAQISAARAYEAPPERVRQMEYAREQLNDSLQRVSYAQTLLGL